MILFSITVKELSDQWPIVLCQEKATGFALFKHFWQTDHMSDANFHWLLVKLKFKNLAIINLLSTYNWSWNEMSRFHNYISHTCAKEFFKSSSVRPISSRYCPKFTFYKYNEVSVHVLCNKTNPWCHHLNNSWQCPNKDMHQICQDLLKL